MASHKKLQSVSRSIADSFTSLMNYSANDYVMGHLLKAARTTGMSRLDVDLLSGIASPKALLLKPVAYSVDAYCQDLSSLVRRSGSDIAFVRSASLSVEFSPYTCAVRIEDDRGKTYESDLKGCWYPEM